VVREERRMNLVVRPARLLVGTLRPPGDKSVSHRVLVLGALASGRTLAAGLSDCGDVRSTARCLRALGVSIRTSGGKTLVEPPARGLRRPRGPLDCGNSGTTLRLLAGLLAAEPFDAVLTGDASLRRRPMERVAAPLRRMGASVRLASGGRAPMRVRGGLLKGAVHRLEVASAQVKTALLLAGLRAQGRTRVVEPAPSRDHTERLLPLFGAAVRRRGLEVSVRGRALRGARLRVPGDFSCAAPFIAAAAMLPGSRLRAEGVGLNPTRLGFLRILRRMGARIRVVRRRAGTEPEGTLEVRGGNLRATTVLAREVPSAIDELLLLAVLAARARGVTRLRGARELRVKESDRIASAAALLRALGAEIRTFPDGFEVRGPQRLRGGRVDCRGDHRVAMAAAAAALCADGPTALCGSGCAAVSYPAFFRELRRLARR
jgi:3-phosphoshikimate 1-carboxyvinyltransferase